jgi:hypothetical protein
LASTISSKQREAGLASIAARGRDEKVQRNRATFYWQPRTNIACFSEPDATPCAPFCERQFSSHLDYCQMDLRLQTAMPH